MSESPSRINDIKIRQESIKFSTGNKQSSRIKKFDSHSKNDKQIKYIHNELNASRAHVKKIPISRLVPGQRKVQNIFNLHEICSVREISHIIKFISVYDHCGVIREIRAHCIPSYTLSIYINFMTIQHLLYYQLSIKFFFLFIIK